MMDIAERLKERSTWLQLIQTVNAVSFFTGVIISPEHAELIVSAGAAIGTLIGIAGALTRDRGAVK